LKKIKRQTGVKKSGTGAWKRGYGGALKEAWKWGTLL